MILPDRFGFDGPRLAVGGLSIGFSIVAGGPVLLLQVREGVPLVFQVLGLKRRSGTGLVDAD